MTNDGNAPAGGLLYIITGDGKGKSSSAFGMVLRTLGWGGRAAVLQFCKNDRETGERRFFRELESDRLIFESCGGGLSWEKADHAVLAQAGWRRATEFLAGTDPACRVDLLVLDELNVALHFHWLDTAAVVAALSARRPGLHVVVTGRWAPAPLLAISDLVSEIVNRKHPFEHGVSAVKGLDW